MIVGKEINGAVRWINVFGILVQPSEFAKVALIIALARFLGRPGRDERDSKTLLYTLLIVGVPFMLIVKQPDLGTGMVMVPICVTMMFVNGLLSYGFTVLTESLSLQIGMSLSGHSLFPSTYAALYCY